VAKQSFDGEVGLFLENTKHPVLPSAGTPLSEGNLKGKDMASSHRAQHYILFFVFLINDNRIQLLRNSKKKKNGLP
jgi:hypothetical protein